MPLNYCTDIPQHESVLIIASGPSASQDWESILPDNLPVIAVSGAIRKLPRADYWFTLDPSIVNKELMASPKKGTRYFCAVPDNFGDPGARPGNLRGPILPHVSYLRRVSGVDKGFPSRGSIYTGNSGFGAVQLAIQMGARRIGIVGIDCTDTYWYGPGRPGSLMHLPSRFFRAKPDIDALGIQVRIGSTFTKPAISCFPSMKPVEVVAWLG